MEIKLKPRLQAIADLIDYNSKVIDVGCDHALLDIYLTKYKKCICLGTDISEKCIERATLNTIKYNSNVLLKVNDGLKGLKLDDEIIVISGMGTRTIKKILDDNINNDLIIVSHTDINELKEFLKNKNYYIKLEKEIFDKHKYTILKVTK